MVSFSFRFVRAWAEIPDASQSATSPWALPQAGMRRAFGAEHLPGKTLAELTGEVACGPTYLGGVPRARKRTAHPRPAEPQASPPAWTAQTPIVENDEENQEPTPLPAQFHRPGGHAEVAVRRGRVMRINGDNVGMQIEGVEQDTHPCKRQKGR